MSALAAGEALRAIRTRAVKKNDRYVINGTKTWITDAGNCDWGIVFARTGEQGERGGITALLVDSKMKGISFKKIPVIRSYSPYEVHFDNVEVPFENRLGEEGEGFKVADRWLVEGRLPYAAGVIAVAQLALCARKESTSARGVLEAERARHRVDRQTVDMVKPHRTGFSFGDGAFEQGLEEQAHLGVGCSA